MAAIEPVCASQTGQAREFAAELKALFLLQRFVGLRIIDGLVLARSGLTGNRLTLHTVKTGALVEADLTPGIVMPLQALSPARARFRPEYFLWSKTVTQGQLTSLWDSFIQPLNDKLNFKDEHGNPKRFHSHMLRDTFAVELLLGGMSLDNVSRLLTHKSTKITERYYAHWITRRRDKLREEAYAALMEQDRGVAAPSTIPACN
jgi:hypothetical protein